MAIFGSQDEKQDGGQESGHKSDVAVVDDKAHQVSGEAEHGAADKAHAGDDHGEQSHGHDLDYSTMAGLKGHFLSPDHLISHVQDSNYFEFPSITGWIDPHHPPKIYIPNPLGHSDENPMIAAPAGLEKYVAPTTFAPTKFVVLELFAAILIAAIAIPYARRVRGGERPQGRFWNLVDVVVCYVKEQIAEPAIGKSDSKRFLPFLWTLFFFVLTLNLFGMIPGVGSATGSITITAALAFVVFAVVVGSGSKKMGLLGFWLAQVPHMELPFGLGYLLVPMIWMIEVFGLFVKHVVLAVRLFANMFAGHLVLAVFIAFVGVVGYYSSIIVGPAVLAIMMLELMVAFIQAYVFTFLAALFIGAAVHPH